jgi:hypothetical protein
MFLPLVLLSYQIQSANVLLCFWAYFNVDLMGSAVYNESTVCIYIHIYTKKSMYIHISIQHIYAYIYIYVYSSAV